MNTKVMFLLPIIIGVIMAIFSIIPSFLDNQLEKIYKKNPNSKWLTLVGFFLVLTPTIAYSLLDLTTLPDSERVYYNKLVGYVASVLISLLSSCILFFLKCLKMNYKEQNVLEKTMECLESTSKNIAVHPLLNTTNELNSIFSSLLNVKYNTKDVVKFVQLSFNDILNKGFVRIDASFSEYSNFLGSLMSKSQDIVGSYSVRPCYLQNVLTRPCGVTYLKEYVEKVNHSQSKIKRICVFSIEDINNILIDECLNEAVAVKVKEKRTFPSGRKREPLFRCQISSKEKPKEIKWFEDNIKSSQCIWTLSGQFFDYINRDSTKIVASKDSFRKFWDFAIFDSEVLVIWRDNDIFRGEINSEDPSGTIVVAIGKQVQNFYSEIQGITNESNSAYVKPSFNELIVSLEGLEGDILQKDSKEHQAEVKLFKELLKKARG